MTMNQNYQKSVLDTYTATAQTLVTGANVALNNNRVLTGCSISHSAGTPTITLNKPGLYQVTLNADVAMTTAAGNVIVTLFNNGVAVPGAAASANSTVVTDLEHLSLTTIVQVKPSCCAVDNTANILFNNSGVGASYSNVIATVTKLC